MTVESSFDVRGKYRSTAGLWLCSYGLFLIETGSGRGIWLAENQILSGVSCVL